MKVRTEFYHQSEEDVHWTHKFHFLPFFPLFRFVLVRRETYYGNSLLIKMSYHN